jgi:predicted nucleic acid-binding protein
MRAEFPGHYRLPAAELKRLWKESVVVVDTSVLLDIFRVSEDTANQLLATLEALHSRLWLPYDVAREYHSNLERVIADQAKPYDEASKQLGELVAAFTASRKHPFVGADVLERFQAVAGELDVELRAGFIT